MIIFSKPSRVTGVYRLLDQSTLFTTINIQASMWVDRCLSVRQRLVNTKHGFTTPLTPSK